MWPVRVSTVNPCERTIQLGGVMYQTGVDEKLASNVSFIGLRNSIAATVSAIGNWVTRHTTALPPGGRLGDVMLVPHSGDAIGRPECWTPEIDVALPKSHAPSDAVAAPFLSTSQRSVPTSPDRIDVPTLWRVRRTRTSR